MILVLGQCFNHQKYKLLKREWNITREKKQEETDYEKDRKT